MLNLKIFCNSRYSFLEIIFTVLLVKDLKSVGFNAYNVSDDDSKSVGFNTYNVGDDDSKSVGFNAYSYNVGDDDSKSVGFNT